MANSRLLSLLVFAVAVALGVASCSQGTQEAASGSLSLQLTIAGDIEIDEVAWVITGGDMPSMNGTIDTSAPGSTASIEVFGLPPSIGEDYRITMEAIATDGETTCKGSEDFGIDIGEVTEIMVMLNCKRPQRFGSVRANGKFNICAELAKVVVSPLQTSVGNDIDLFSAAKDLDDDNIHYLWIGTGGSFDDADAASTTYTCTDIGDHFVKITVTDEPDSEVCDSSWTVQVSCCTPGFERCSGIPIETWCFNYAVEEGFGGDGDAACQAAAGTVCVQSVCEDSLAVSGSCSGGICCVDTPAPDFTPCSESVCPTGGCFDGICAPIPDCLTAPDCDDSNPCTEVICEPVCGTCENLPRPDGTTCDLVGVPGVCQAGECTDG